MFFFNLIIIEFDSFLYDNYLYLYITHILLNNYDYGKKILIFYRTLNFNKLTLVSLLKKIYFKKLGNLTYIYTRKKKKDVSIILENLQCIRKSSWFIRKYNSKINKFFFLQNTLPIYTKKAILFEYVVNIEILI